MLFGLLRGLQRSELTSLSNTPSQSIFSIFVKKRDGLSQTVLNMHWLKWIVHSRNYSEVNLH